jgi:hypothetical protein
MWQPPASRPPAFFVHDRHDVSRGVKLGVNWLAGWTAEHGGSPLIITPTRESERRVVLMAPQASRFERQSIATSFRSPWSGGAVLAIWPDDKTLGIIDDHPRVAAVCAVLDGLEDGPLWARTRRPVEVGGAHQIPPAAVIADPVVRVALTFLTHCVNLSTGLVNPRDRGHAIDVLRALAKGRRQVTPDDAYAWAIQNGWRADAARDLRELVVGVAAGKRYRDGGMLVAPSQLLRIWQNEADAQQRGGES